MTKYILPIPNIIYYPNQHLFQEPAKALGILDFNHDQTMHLAGLTTVCKVTRNAIIPLNNASVHLTATVSNKCGGDSNDDKSKETCKQERGEREDSCDPCNCYQCPSDSNPSAPNIYDSRKYGHCLPSNNVTPCFDILPNIPSGIFRCTEGEVLGRCGADKDSSYKCPEYFSYQHMTFFDMHVLLRAYRNPCPRTERKP